MSIFRLSSKLVFVYVNQLVQTVVVKHVLKLVEFGIEDILRNDLFSDHEGQSLCVETFLVKVTGQTQRLRESISNLVCEVHLLSHIIFDLIYIPATERNFSSWGCNRNKPFTFPRHECS